MDTSIRSSIGSASIVQRSAVASLKGARFLAVVGFMVALFSALACSAQQPAGTQGGEQSSVAGQPQYGGVLKVHWIGTPPTDLNALWAAGSTGVIRVSPVYSQLVRYDPAKSAEAAVIVPDLAERWEYSADGKILTFYLRKNAKWNDGTPVTSADVKYTFDRILDPKDPEASKMSSKRLRMPQVVRVEAVDDHTLRLHLNQPSASLLILLGYGNYFIVPKHAWPKIDPLSDMMGSGPFRLKKYTAGVSIEYEKNPDYFVKDKPYLDGVIDHFLKDNATRVAAFETKQLDMLRFIDKPVWDSIRNDVPEAELVPWNALRASLLAMNTARKPYDDPRVRKAISMALDRREGSQLLGGGWGTIGGYITAGPWALPEAELRKMPGYSGDPKADVAEAKKLLAEAGYTQGFKADLVTTTNHPLYEASSVWVKDQLKKNLNIDVTVELLAGADYGNRYQGGTFDMHLLLTAASYDDPSGHATFWGPGNPYSFNDKEIFDLLDRQDLTLDVAERKKLVNEMERKLLERGPYPVITWVKLGTAVHPWVKNHFEPVGLYSGHQYDHVWLTK